MPGPKGTYVYGTSYSWNGEWDYENHRVMAADLRKYAKRSLFLKDGPDTPKLARRWGKWDERTKWYVVPDGGDEPNNEWKAQNCKKARAERRGCNVSHLISAENVKKFCLSELGMEEIQPEVVEVEKIVEVQVEVGIALSFEEHDILTNALHREQHITNEMIRRSLEAEDEHEARLYTGRMATLHELMAKFGINPDAWVNGPVWLADTNFARLITERPGLVVDEPQLRLGF